MNWSENVEIKIIDGYYFDKEYA